MTPGAEAAARFDAAILGAEEALRLAVPPPEAGRAAQARVLAGLARLRVSIQGRLDLDAALREARQALRAARAPLAALLGRVRRRRRALLAQALFWRVLPVLAWLALGVLAVTAAALWGDDLLRLGAALWQAVAAPPAP